METLICNDTIEYITKAIHFLRKVKHIRPTAEKIYNSIRKETDDKLDIVEYGCKTNIDYLINNGIVEVRGEVDQESVFVVERTKGSSEELGEKTISETNILTEIQIAQKEDKNTEIRLGNPLRTLDIEHKIRNKLFKKPAPGKGHFFLDEITFLRRQVSETLAKKVDTSAYLSSSTIPVNADERLVNGDLVNSKPESSTRSDSKKTNTKEKLSTETNVNSKASNNVERQRRETEKKNESASRKTRIEYNGKKDQNKSQKIVILGDSMIKNIKGWEISKKLQNANVYVRHFSGAKVRCMKDYLKPSLRENPDHFVLHVGTNDLDSDRSPDLIAKSTVDAASTLKTDKPDVTISNSITRNDRFMGKANEVNKCLTKLCFERNFLFQDFEIAALEWE